MFCILYYTLAWSVNEFYNGIYTYTECKSQTIYTHNAGIFSGVMESLSACEFVHRKMRSNVLHFLEAFESFKKCNLGF
jgi:hypothetical protein